MTDTVEKLRGLLLSANELQVLNPTWGPAMIEDYLTIFENIIKLAELLDVEIHQKLEEVPTDFTDGSIPFADGGFLVEDNDNLWWDDILLILMAESIALNNLTPSRMVYSDATKKIVSIANLTLWVTGSDLQTINDDGDGTASHNDDELEFYIQAVA